MPDDRFQLGPGVRTERAQSAYDLRQEFGESHGRRGIDDRESAQPPRGHMVGEQTCQPGDIGETVDERPIPVRRAVVRPRWRGRRPSMEHEHVSATGGPEPVRLLDAHAILWIDSRRAVGGVIRVGRWGAQCGGLDVVHESRAGEEEVARAGGFAVAVRFFEGGRCSIRRR